MVQGKARIEKHGKISRKAAKAQRYSQGYKLERSSRLVIIDEFLSA